MTERSGMPRNQEGQAPTRNADETEARLQEKERSQRGGFPLVDNGASMGVSKVEPGRILNCRFAGKSFRQ